MIVGEWKKSGIKERVQEKEWQSEEGRKRRRKHRIKKTKGKCDEKKKIEEEERNQEGEVWRRNARKVLQGNKGRKKGEPRNTRHKKGSEEK